VAWGRVGEYLVGDDVALVIDAVLLVIGAAVATVISAWWATSIGRSGVGLEGANGGWLIPPVMNLIVPLAIVPLITANPQHAPWLVPLALAFWGIGAILFLALLAVLVARLAFRTPLAAPMAPSLWIPLAPAGVLGLSLLRTLQAGAETEVLPENVVALGIVVSAAGIGFGLWWALFAWFDLARARREGVPFHPRLVGFRVPDRGDVLIHQRGGPGAAGATGGDPRHRDRRDRYRGLAARGSAHGARTQRGSLDGSEVAAKDSSDVASS